MPTLTHLDVEWVSLVDRAAVRDPVQQSEPNRFLIWKRQTSDEGDRMTPEEQAAYDKAQAALKKAQDDLATATAELAKSSERITELEKAAAPKDEPKPIDKSDLPPAVREALEKAEAREAEAIAKAEKAEQRANAAAERAEKAEDARLTREYVAKAEGYKGLTVKAAEFGPVLKACAEKLTKEEFAALETVLTAADAQIAEGDLFTEQGRSREAAAPEGALAEATLKAQEIRKSDPKLSPAKALDMAFTADPALQARYLADVRR